MSEESAHEKYLRGEPINEELKALHEGRTLPQNAPEMLESPEPLEDIERELTKKERLALQAIRKLPGYQILMRVHEKAFHLHRKSAIGLSEFGTRAEDSERLAEWELVRMYRRVGKELFLLVDAEIKQLQPKKKNEAKKAT